MSEDSIRKRRFINTYVKYTAKKPILLFAMIAFFISLILYISLTTKTNLYQTFDGVLSEDCITIDKDIYTVPEVVYVYENRNEAVFAVNVERFENRDNTTILHVSFADGSPELDPSENVKVDIQVGEITLFERVFVKGGKVNG